MKLNEWERFIEANGFKAIIGKLNNPINSDVDIEYLNSVTDILIKCICS